MASSPQEDDSGQTTPDPLGSHHAHDHARRLWNFVSVSGKNIFIVHTPEEHERRRKELLKTSGPDEFDVLVNGTPEHVTAIRELQEFHQKRRDSLREEHGDVYEQFENVKRELDLLSNELHMITDHGVSLDANFSKFGYSANLRTKDESETSSQNSERSSVARHHDRSAEPIKFWKRPVVRQVFHRGLLWRSAQSGEVASFELFIDLLYVGVIGVIGDKAVDDPTGKSFLQFAITFIIAWKILSEVTMIVNWFEIDDIFQRVAVLFYLVCLFGFTTNIDYAFESTYTSMIAFYLTERLFAAVWYVWVAYLLPTIRGTMLYHTLITAVSAALWIASIHLDYPANLGPIFVAIVIDLSGSVILIWVVRAAKKKGADFMGRLNKYFDFYPGINIEHRTERNNAFVTLVFGYSVLTILFQSRASFGLNAIFGKGILGLIQAFAFNWIYFEIDQYNVHVHAIRRHWFSSTVWVSLHLPFVMAYVLAAATLSQLVLAHDCSDARADDLGEDYVGKSVAELSPGLRWYYCGGIGVALLCMAAISLTHIHKRLARPRLRKRPRLVVRAVIALIIILLPLAKSLSSLDLITITTCLVVLVLILDLFGNLCEGDKFWTGGFCAEQKRSCRYYANCKVEKKRRKEIERALNNGERVSLADLLKRQTTNNSMSSLESEKQADAEWQGGHY